MNLVDISRSVVLSITDASRIGSARREAACLAQQAGFDATETGKVSIVVTEAASNILKHAGQGLVAMRHTRLNDIDGLEVLAIDKGPGMANVSRCLEDGYSTAGSPGTGLGAIARLSDYVDIFSEPGKGTVVMSLLWGGRPQKSVSSLIIGAVCAPMHEHDPCGDAWAIRQSRDRTEILIADGLGHGPYAAHAADEALRVFATRGPRSGVELLKDMHGVLKSTRGASVAVADISSPEGTIQYTGVGNISGIVFTDDTRKHLVSHNGTVGHELQRVSTFVYPWAKSSMLIMHSDGLMTRWNVDSYAGLIMRHPSVIAAVLFRDFSRGRDDITVVVACQTARGKLS